MTPLQRYLAYLDKLPSAISGSGGHDATFRAACEGFRFGLSAAEVGEGLRAYNVRCQPPWAEKELDHKIAEAEEEVRASGEYGRRVGFTGKPKRSRKNSEAASLRIARKHAARFAVNRETTVNSSKAEKDTGLLPANRLITEKAEINLPSLGSDQYGPLPLPAAIPLADFRRAVAARTGNSGNDGNAPDYWQFILAGEAEALALAAEGG